MAASGEKALVIAQSDAPPDLLLLDIMMPGMDGYEVCRRLKANEATRHIPVIFLTARSAPDDEREGLALEDNVVEWALSCAKVVDKPVAFDDLMGRNAAQQ